MKAIDAGNRDLFVIRRTTQLLLDRGRFAQADEVLKKLQAAGAASDNVLQQMSAAAAAGVGDAERALSQARQAIKNDTKDVKELIWFSQILLTASRQAEADGRKEEAKGRLVEAEKTLRRAVELAGENADPWVMLTRFLVATQQRTKAQETVQDAEKHLVGPRYTLALAQCYEVTGQADRAAALYQQALAAQPNDPVILRNLADYCLRKGACRKRKHILIRSPAWGPGRTRRRPGKPWPS